MQITFRVQWRRMWRSLTIYISIAILIPVAFIMIIQGVRAGFDEAFGLVTALGVLGVTIGVIFVAAIFALVVSTVCRLAAVRIDDDFVEGRNYWGFKRKLPLTDISSIYPFSSNGFEAIVVATRKHGKIYIVKQTENLEDLFALLNTYVPQPK